MKFTIVLASFVTILAIDSFALVTPVHGHSVTAAAGKKVVCYFGSWAKYRHGLGTFDVENIDPLICTHLIFGFSGLRLNDHTMYALDDYNELEENWGRGAYKRFTNLKLQNPNLKTLLAIGGWNEATSKYSDMALTAANRKRFIDSVIPFLQHQNFDGLDLDWEYPANDGCCGGARPEDRENFALLCSEMKQEFNKHGLLLTAAVSAGESTIATAYDIPRISRDLDFINIMTYDFHGAWDKFTHHHTPMDTFPGESVNHTLLNVKHAVNYWISQGAPREKLILGMGTYGRGFTLDDANNNGYYAPATAWANGIPAGPYTREAGFWGYNEIIERFIADGWSWTIVRNPYTAAPYAYKGNLWIGYDDEISIAVKTNYAIEMGLGGGMFWSVETDDFHGLSGEKNPLIKTAYRLLNGEIPPPPPPPTTTTTTPDPNVPTTVATTTTTHPPNTQCQYEGLNGEKCSVNFIQCRWYNDDWIVYEFKCAGALVFNPAIRNCDYFDVVGC